MRSRVFGERHRRADLGHPEARRRLHRRGRSSAAGCASERRRVRRRSRRPRSVERGRRRGSALAGARRRVAVRLPTAGHPLRGPPAAAARPGRAVATACLAEIAELVWAAGGRTLGLFSSRRAAETAAVHVRKQLPKLTILCQGDAQLSELTRRFVAEEADQPVRHPVAVAGDRRARRHLPAGDHRPDPVPAARRAADRGPAAGGRRGGRQRVHGRRGHPRRAAAGPGLRSADPPAQRPGRGRGAGPAAGHGPLRRLPAGLDAGHVADHRPRDRHRGAAPASADRPSSRRRVRGRS